MSLSTVKKLVINIMVVCLIGAAGIAIVAVLAGSFNETFGRALFTLLVVMLHALASLGFLESRDRAANQNDFKFLTNITFTLLILSFLTAVFGIWEVLPAAVVGKAYLMYLLIIVASLHGDALQRITGLTSRINTLVYVNFGFMAAVVLMLLLPLWTSADTFPGFYYRLLAVLAIVDATLTILAVIFYRLHEQRLPAPAPIPAPVVQPVADPTAMPASAMPMATTPVAAPTRRRGLHPLVWVLITAVILVQVVPALLFILIYLFAVLAR